MKVVINRLRWLSAGIYLGLALFAWLEQDSKKNKTTIDLTKNWSDYKHNHTKDKVNA